MQNSDLKECAKIINMRFFRIFFCIFVYKCIYLYVELHKYTNMKSKNDRLKALRMLISSKELCSQEEVLRALEQEGFNITQATLSRDMKQLKIAKATNLAGKYFYVLPNETMFKRISSPKRVSEMLLVSGFLSINFSGNIGVVKTQPGYASSLAYNIDNSGVQSIIGTIAGNDTIFIVIKENINPTEVILELKTVIPDIK